MHSSGVMPMPPASSTLCVALWASAKWFFGALMPSTSPSCTCSCIAREPPREPASFSTAMR